MTPTKRLDHIKTLAANINLRLSFSPFVDKIDVSLETTTKFVPICLYLPDEEMDEELYAIALHELGHATHPEGLPKTVSASMMMWRLPMRSGDGFDLIRSEVIAWRWAKATALEWTPAMEAIYHLGFDSYLANAETYGITKNEMERLFL